MGFLMVVLIKGVLSLGSCWTILLLDLEDIGLLYLPGGGFVCARERRVYPAFGVCRRKVLVLVLMREKGCDASILFYGPSTEKFAGPNLSVRGNKFIDSLKDIAEEECTGVVSCADIIAIATKKLIKMGGGPDYLVQTGRRDGLISEAQDVSLPSPFGSVRQSILAFGDKNFSPEEMVALFGAHTVGISQCIFFQDRLYQGTSEFDPKMDPNLRRQLIPTCPQGTNSNNFTFLDQNSQSSNNFDNSFFDQILKQRGILEIDQELARDPRTRGFVLRFARNAALFSAKLVSVMVKMQALDVHLGDQGQIRKVCSKVD
ncbi:peroxidase 57-like [Chenopodium quinoa]|uniref:peroxidase 57-like n=1 Tax=Chenopodium quinoa TaxID=63459 RepID=UPI000B77E3D6|nr:peroxidase 57-like [Chenopodium quinoa]